ncbi:MAG: hypothetical protein HY735_17860, partial [Verrucomicrobia bacterium]|nr:hypothetical protein [Verrucomicrobiota bacterium]
GRISPEEAVRAYHGVLQGKNIKPHRSLEDDLRLTDQSMSYDGSAARRATGEVRDNPLAGPKPPQGEGRNQSLLTSAATANGEWPKLANGSPDFAKMNSAQRRACDHARLARKFG